MPKLFISYRRKSWTFTHRLVDDLRTRLDAQIYIDKDNIDQAEFERSILPNLRTSNGVLLIVSEHTFDSSRIHQDDDWVRREIREAIELHIPIVLVCVDGLLPPEKLPKDISTIGKFQGINFYPEYYSSAVERLVEFIARVITGVKIKDAPAPKPVTQASNFDIHEAIDRYDTAMDAEKWHDARDILEEIRDSKQTSPGFVFAKQWDKVTGIISKIETNAVRDKAYRGIQRRYLRLSMDELKDALNDFWQTYPDYDPSYLVKPRPHVWIKIPAGKVTLEAGGYLQEPTTFEIPAFEIGKYPVTVAQYDEFIQDNGYQNVKWWGDFAHRFNPPKSLESFSRPDHPRINISWFETIAYCFWLSTKLNKIVMLPTEQQWQRAAQGDDNRTYPWGDDWDKTRFNHSIQFFEKSNDTTSVASYDNDGNSPYYISDMLGNVWEWCLTGYYTGNVDTVTIEPRVLRGGPWKTDATDYFQITKRYSKINFDINDNFGFRCVLLK